MLSARISPSPSNFYSLKLHLGKLKEEDYAELILRFWPKFHK